MEEKKKRVRPTWSMVHELENEIGVLKAKIELLEQVADNRAEEVRRLQSRGFFARLFNK